MSAADGAWRSVAWEGVRLDTPVEWEFLTLSPGYLVMGAETQPALELKSRSGSGRRFSGRKLLKQLSRGMSSPVRRRFCETPVPEDWRHQLDGFSATGFKWHHGSSRGKGVVLHCRDCDRIHLLQFFSPPVRDRSVISRVMGSFQDHQKNGWRPFHVFDIRFDIPAGFETRACKFEPGRFDMTFRGDGSRIRLLRWSPANVILRKKTLETFLIDQGLMSSGPRWQAFVEDKWVEWTRVDGKKRNPFRIGSRRGRFGCRRLRAAHLRPENRLLALFAESRTPFSNPLFEQLWTSYGTVAATATAAGPEP